MHSPRPRYHDSRDPSASESPVKLSRRPLTPMGDDLAPDRLLPILSSQATRHFPPHLNWSGEGPSAHTRKCRSGVLLLSGDLFAWAPSFSGLSMHSSMRRTGILQIREGHGINLLAALSMHIWSCHLCTATGTDIQSATLAGAGHMG